MKKQPASNIQIAKQKILEGEEAEILITLHGKPAMVLIDYKHYQKLKNGLKK